MKVFITGGTGFVGRHLVRQLVASGHDVQALAGNRAADSALRILGATPVPGHVTDRASLEGAMGGCDVVYHLPNTQWVTSEDSERVQTQIVAGTQHTLGAAFDLNIPRIVFFSNVSVYGDTNGQLVDETYVPSRPPAGEIPQALWHAHFDVAQQLTRQGAPIVTVMPGEIYGPGETGWLANLMRRFYRGSLPVIPAPETTFTYTYVKDVVRGAILAAEKGRIGESYCLTGPAVPLGELIEFWAQLTGRRAPSISMSARSLRAMPLLVDTVIDETLRDMLGGTYMASSDKARRELGWSTQPMQPTTLETFEWIAATEPADRWEKRRHTGLLALVGVAGVGAAWLLARPKSRPSAATLLPDATPPNGLLVDEPAADESPDALVE